MKPGFERANERRFESAADILRARGAAGSLAVLGYDPNLARVYGVAYHLYAFGFTAVLGLIFMALRGIDLVGSVRRSRDANKSA